MYMWIPKMKSISVIILALLFSVTYAFAEEMSYTNLFDKHGAALGIQADGVRLNDVILPATQCALTEEFACVLSKVLVFSVPRNDKNLKSWSHSVVFPAKLRSYEFVTIEPTLPHSRRSIFDAEPHLHRSAS